MLVFFFFFFSSRRRHTRSLRDWSSDVCSSDLGVSRSGLFSKTSNTGVRSPGTGEQHRPRRLEIRHRGISQGQIPLRGRHRPVADLNRELHIVSPPLGASEDRDPRSSKMHPGKGREPRRTRLAQLGIQLEPEPPSRQQTPLSLAHHFWLPRKAPRCPNENPTYA